jgi:2Fe-2S ferredoxin
MVSSKGGYERSPYDTPWGECMTQLVVATRAGDEKAIDVAGGLSLMQALRESGFDEILGMCGGVCACATCHIYVDSAYLDRLSPMTADEEALLDGSEARTAQSRLSCQICCDEIPMGLKVRIAPED